MDGEGYKLWSPPDNRCTAGVRPSYNPNNQTCNGGNCLDCPGSTCDYCGIPPEISNIKVDKANIDKSGFVNLTFNTRVDSQQLPLVMYQVDWGDGNTITISGVEMRDRPNPDVPHSLYHAYNYWEMVTRENSSDPNEQLSNGSCGGGSCSVRPQIKIKDNWGWYNNCNSRGDCDQWIEGPWITVTQ